MGKKFIRIFSKKNARICNLGLLNKVVFIFIGMKKFIMFHEVISQNFFKKNN